MKSTRVHLLLLLTLLLPLGLKMSSVAVYGDGGMIPIAVSGKARVKNVHLYEPTQSALICWAEGQERLILSTSFHGSAACDALLLLPLPAEPQVAVAGKQIFDSLETFVNQRRPASPPYPDRREQVSWEYGRASRGGTETDGRIEGASRPAVEVLVRGAFHGHDFEVVKVVAVERVADYVASFCEKRSLPAPRVPAALTELVRDYVERRSCPYFVLDRLQVKTAPRRLLPLCLTFPCPEVFYPMTISRLNAGECRVSLTLITSPPLVNRSSFEIGAMVSDELTFERLERMGPAHVQTLQGEDLGGLDLESFLYQYDVKSTSGNGWVEGYTGQPIAFPVEYNELGSLDEKVQTFFDPYAGLGLLRLGGRYSRELPSKSSRPTSWLLDRWRRKSKTPFDTVQPFGADLLLSTDRAHDVSIAWRTDEQTERSRKWSPRELDLKKLRKRRNPNRLGDRKTLESLRRQRRLR